MAWNRPNSEKVEKRGGGGQRYAHLRGLFGALIVVLGAGIAAWWLWPTQENSEDTASTVKTTRIKEVKVAQPQHGETPRPPEEDKPATNAIPKGAYRDAGGTLRSPSGMRIVEGPIYRRARPKDEKPSMFATHVENEIATLLTLKPGTQRFGIRMYTPQFDKDLRASMKLGDQIKETDTEEEKEIKRLVWETKQELIDRMDKGEKLQQIISETQKEMQRLATYRRTLLQGLDDIIANKDMTDKDMEDYIGAANSILEENGMQKITGRASFFKGNVKLENFLRKVKK